MIFFWNSTNLKKSQIMIQVHLAWIDLVKMAIWIVDCHYRWCDRNCRTCNRFGILRHFFAWIEHQCLCWLQIFFRWLTWSNMLRRVLQAVTLTAWPKQFKLLLIKGGIAGWAVQWTGVAWNGKRQLALH